LPEGYISRKFRNCANTDIPTDAKLIPCCSTDFALGYRRTDLTLSRDRLASTGSKQEEREQMDRQPAELKNALEDRPAIIAGAVANDRAGNLAQ